MNSDFHSLVLKATGAETITSSEVLQTLWSGYGEIVRLRLGGSNLESIVLKYIVLPDEVVHPRGWNTNHSHQRKVRSYDVETQWYRDWSRRCDASCRVADCFALSSGGNEHLIVLEDLDAAGFPRRYEKLDLPGVKLCLRWLANFHATFMNDSPNGLWPTGTYWHLETRPDELAAMPVGALKKAAGDIDARLSGCHYQTLVHGDAKVANFCFSIDGLEVAAVDFQYVGGGCGMKDVAYFLGSCLNEVECERWQSELLMFYFGALKEALEAGEKVFDWEALEQEWRTMFPLAWTDFYRFLVGWMPTHHKINRYTERLAAEVVEQIS